MAVTTLTVAAVGLSAYSARSNARDAINQNREIAGQEAQYQADQLAQQQAQLVQQQQAMAQQQQQFDQQTLLYQEQLGMQAAAQEAQSEQFAIAQERAEKTEQANEEALNRSLRKRPNSSRILSASRQAGRTGASSTLLTGTKGVDKGSLSLGKNVLLGA